MYHNIGLQQNAFHVNQRSPQTPLCHAPLRQTSVQFGVRDEGYLPQVNFIAERMNKEGYGFSPEEAWEGTTKIDIMDLAEGLSIEKSDPFFALQSLGSYIAKDRQALRLKLPTITYPSLYLKKTSAGVAASQLSQSFWITVLQKVPGVRGLWKPLAKPLTPAQKLAELQQRLDEMDNARLRFENRLENVRILNNTLNNAKVLFTRFLENYKVEYGQVYPKVFLEYYDNNEIRCLP